MMKKTFIILAMLASFTYSFAPLKVNSNGCINLFQSSQNKLLLAVETSEQACSSTPSSWMDRNKLQ